MADYDDEDKAPPALTEKLAAAIMAKLAANPDTPENHAARTEKMRQVVREDEERRTTPRLSLNKNIKRLETMAEAFRGKIAQRKYEGVPIDAPAQELMRTAFKAVVKAFDDANHAQPGHEVNTDQPLLDLCDQLMETPCVQSFGENAESVAKGLAGMIVPHAMRAATDLEISMAHIPRSRFYAYRPQAGVGIS